jgi:hypothetical protein
MHPYIILCFKGDPDETQEFFLCKDFKHLKDMELQLRNDPTIDYYEVHVTNLIKSYTNPISRFDDC